MTPASVKCPQFQRASKDDNGNCCQNMATICRKQIRHKYDKKLRRQKAEMARNLSKYMTRKCQNIWQAIMARNCVNKSWQEIVSRKYDRICHGKVEYMACCNMPRQKL